MSLHLKRCLHFRLSIPPHVIKYLFQTLSQKWLEFTSLDHLAGKPFALVLHEVQVAG